MLTYRYFCREKPMKNEATHCAHFLSVFFMTRQGTLPKYTVPFSARHQPGIHIKRMNLLNFINYAQRGYIRWTIWIWFPLGIGKTSIEERRSHGLWDSQAETFRLVLSSQSLRVSSSKEVEKSSANEFRNCARGGDLGGNFMSVAAVSSEETRGLVRN